MKKLTHRQFASYLKKNGETMATLTDNFHDFRAGDSLFFQLIPNSYISTGHHVYNKNRKLFPSRDCQWTESWCDVYRGYFLIKENDKYKQFIK